MYDLVFVTGVGVFRYGSKYPEIVIMYIKTTNLGEIPEYDTLVRGDVMIDVKNSNCNMSFRL